MLKVGIIGLGAMGTTHLDVCSRRGDVQVVAVADTDPQRRSGKSVAKGNVPGQAQGGFDYSQVRQYADGMELIRDPEVALVDICLITTLHERFAIEAMRAGKHLLIEKPLARTAVQSDAIVAEAKRTGVIAMPAMCIRFWPGWTWLKSAVAQGRYGKVLAASFRRVAPHPGGAFFGDGRASGGAALDLHIHDSDFIQYCFGKPKAVTSRGYSSVTNGVDHLVTQYHYDNIPLVMAEGSWAMAPGFPFNMQYTVNFQTATAVYDLAAADRLMLYQTGQAPSAVALETGMGYDYEIAYMVECLQRRQQPTVVTLADAADAVRLIEAEVESVGSGRTVQCVFGG